jgi:hypothetical protein
MVVLVPFADETIKEFVERYRTTLTYVPANGAIFRPHFSEVWSPDNMKEKEKWLNTHIGVDSYWSIAGLWWYFDNDEDATWFKLSF